MDIAVSRTYLGYEALAAVNLDRDGVVLPIREKHWYRPVQVGLVIARHPSIAAAGATPVFHPLIF